MEVRVEKKPISFAQLHHELSEFNSQESISKALVEHIPNNLTAGQLTTMILLLQKLIYYFPAGKLHFG
jgi:hypothetical protein